MPTDLEAVMAHRTKYFGKHKEPTYEQLERKQNPKRKFEGEYTGPTPKRARGEPRVLFPSESFEEGLPAPIPSSRIKSRPRKEDFTPTRQDQLSAWVEAFETHNLTSAEREKRKRNIAKMKKQKFRKAGYGKKYGGR